MFELLTYPPPITDLLWSLINQIPQGRVTTYGTLADALGDQVAKRWIGHELLHHAHDASCLCHRVIRFTGEVGNYVDGEDAKRARLAAEGVHFVEGRVDLAAAMFDSFQLEGEPPLAALTRVQEEVAARVVRKSPRKKPRLVAGLDVSYSGGDGAAACVVFDVESRERVSTVIERRPAPFPYITTYLTFREVPLLLAAWQETLRRGVTPDLVLVDGSGILHPRRAGVACGFGVVADVPTIGVMKSQLCGHFTEAALTFDAPQPITLDGEQLGTAILPRPTTRQPLYVSPGQHQSIAMAADRVSELLWGHRLPEPIYWADRLSRAALSST